MPPNKNPNPKLMIVLMAVAMIVGSVFNILWTIVYPSIQVRMVLGDNRPPANATNEERGAYYLAAMKKAQDNKLLGEAIPRTAESYADWLFDCSNYQEAKKAHLKCAELCVGNNSGAVRTIQADALMSAAFCDHRLYYVNQGPPPDVQVALAAQKQEIEAARSMGWTDDFNDVERQRRTLEDIAEFYCDNGKPAEAIKYSDDAIAVANKNHATPVKTALTHVTKARVLAGLGKNDEADKEFRQAVKMVDTAYGAGSDASELCIRHYAGGLIRDGQTERGEKIKQLQDYYADW